MKNLSSSSIFGNIKNEKNFAEKNKIVPVIKIENILGNDKIDELKKNVNFEELKNNENSKIYLENENFDKNDFLDRNFKKEKLNQNLEKINGSNFYNGENSEKKCSKRENLRSKAEDRKFEESRLKKTTDLLKGIKKNKNLLKNEQKKKNSEIEINQTKISKNNWIYLKSKNPLQKKKTITKKISKKHFKITTKAIIKKIKRKEI